MASTTFDQLFDSLAKTQLSSTEVSQLQEWLTGIDSSDRCIALTEAGAMGRGCPHCCGQHVHRCGQASCFQRFRCLACRRSYNALTGTPLAHDEHDCLLVARDRTGRTLDFHTGRGAVTARQLDACLRPVLPTESLLISDGAAAYIRFAADAGVPHEAINLRAGVRVRGDIHIQNVNGWHARFKVWLVHFRGVASRYLAHYSGWQRLLDAEPQATPAQWLLAAAQRGATR